MRTRLTRLTTLGGTVLALAIMIDVHPSGQTTLPAPTFSKDVAPILYKNCVSCHRPGEIAPMSLLTYDEARPYARSIRAKVADGAMPPWHAEAPAGTFLNDRRLSDTEKNTIVRWADAGAPKGDANDLPPAPTFSEGWSIGTPEAVITMPTAYDVPASGTIAYQYFEAPTNFTEDKWVRAIEVRPGTRRVVHHVLVYSREPGATTRPAAFVARNPGISTTTPATAAATPSATPAATPQADARPRAQGQPTSRGVLIATTAPGTNAMTLQPGTAILIKAGSVLTFQIHYTANGAPSTDQTSVGFVFAKQPPEQEIRTSAFINALFRIPSGASDHRVDSAIEFTEDAHVWALFPHTHLRGKNWEYRLVSPDGQSKVVLSVPKYDFNWQTYYTFAEPLKAPKGSRLEAIAHYDNSAANKSNPDPSLDVRWGDQTWNEMQYSGITFTVDSQRRTISTGGQQ